MSKSYRNNKKNKLSVFKTLCDKFICSRNWLDGQHCNCNCLKTELIWVTDWRYSPVVADNTKESKKVILFLKIIENSELKKRTSNTITTIKCLNDKI